MHIYTHTRMERNLYSVFPLSLLLAKPPLILRNRIITEILCPQNWITCYQNWYIELQELKIISLAVISCCGIVNLTISQTRRNQETWYTNPAGMKKSTKKISIPTLSLAWKCSIYGTSVLSKNIISIEEAPADIISIC